MDSGMVLVALVGIVVGCCVVGCVALVAILHGSFRLKANQDEIDLEASNSEAPQPVAKPKRKSSIKL
jgi:hypothetical protein